MTDLFVNVNAKVGILAIALLTWDKTGGQRRFTISEVAADWHEP